MFQGKITAAIDMLCRQGKTGIPHVSDKVECGEQGHLPVADVLKAKHPAAKSAHPSGLIENSDAYQLFHQLCLIRSQEVPFAKLLCG